MSRWLLSFEALDQSWLSCNVTSKTFDFAPSSCKQFTHETNDVFASTADVGSVFRQATRSRAKWPEQSVYVGREAICRPRSERVVVDAMGHICLCRLEIQLLQNDVNVSRICFDLDGFRSVTSGARPSDDTVPADNFGSLLASGSRADRRTRRAHVSSP